MKQQTIKQSTIKISLSLNPTFMSQRIAFPVESPIPNLKSPREQNQEYFDKVKAIYRGKTYRDKTTRASSHHKSGGSSRNTNNLNTIGGQSQSSNKTNKKNNQYLIQTIQTVQQAQPSVNQKLMTENKSSSPKKIKYFLNKVDRERSFHAGVENDRMLKRIYEIKFRQNKYIKDSQKHTQLSKEHKIMHQSSVIANRKLLQRQIDEKNDKFIDRLVDRAKYKQVIKPLERQKSVKCVRLEESRARIAMRSKGGTLELPPMVFQ